MRESERKSEQEQDREREEGRRGREGERYQAATNEAVALKFRPTEAFRRKTL